MKAIGMYIFGGSQTLGVMQSGYDVDRILEISDSILNKNAYHFNKNYPNIPIILPSEWKSEGYVENLAKNNYDLFFANNPCSGLSRINPNASVNNETNRFFYDVINNIHLIKPKRFLMENAPTLVTTGLPILNDIVNLLSPDYYINIMNDNAGNHNVSMIRPRTIITGYRKDIYDGPPLYNPDIQQITTVKMAIGDLYSDSFADTLPNNELVNHCFNTLIPFYKYVPNGQTVLEMLTNNPKFDKDLPEDWHIVRIKHYREKLAQGKGYWNKSPMRLYENRTAPSLTGLSLFIHPKFDRDLTLREYARLMGYPDDFIFYTDNNDCEVNPIQCIAQGVPVNFIKYVLSQMSETILGNNPIFKNYNIVYQKNQSGKYMLSNSFNESTVVAKYNIKDKFLKRHKRLF